MKRRVLLVSSLWLAPFIFAIPSPARGGEPSLVPQFTFAETPAEQEGQLKTNPLQRVIASRAAQAGDPHRPIYHYVNPEGRLNDPNGLCRWQGRWHLFYQAYPPEDPRQHWGHAVSDDRVHWRDLPLAIYPHPEDKCFSGSTLVEEDRVIAIDHSIAAGRQCVALRVYPGREDSVGVSLRAQGQEAQLRSLDAWQMQNIYENAAKQSP